MKMIKATEYLEQYEFALYAANRARANYELETERIDAIGSTLSGEPGMPHGSGTSNPTADKAVRLVDKGMDLFEARDKARQIQREVFEVAYNIGGVEGDVLIRRYIDLMDWVDVCDAVGYGWSQTHMYHRVGLDKVADKLRIE